MIPERTKQQQMQEGERTSSKADVFKKVERKLWPWDED